MKNDLLTPRDWQHIAQQKAIKLAGTPEAAEKLAEAKRYGMLADEIDRLTNILNLSKIALDSCESWQEIREYAPSVWHKTFDKTAVELALKSFIERD